MAEEPKTALHAHATAPGQVPLRTLVTIRWLAVLGQVSALLFVRFGMGFPLPLAPALAVVAASAALNVFVAFRHRAGARLKEKEAAAYLGFDILQLSVLLYLTGGVDNPFQLLLLAPVTVSATVLSRRTTTALCLLAIGCVSVLAVLHVPLPWPDASFALPPAFRVAVWAATVFAIGFIAAYASQVAMEARRMSDALAASHLALSREQQISALGALAAAAAHELGSPLATIAVVAREIARDLPPDSPLAEDAALLISQTARCRDILAELARRPDPDGDPFLRLSLGDLIEQAAEPHRRPEIALELRRGAAEGPEPRLVRSPEIVHGIGNILANAIQFARRRVEVTLRWDEQRVAVTIADDGPGFPPALLGRLGEPYLSSRREEGEHMGLGIFIAETLLQRTGAVVSYRNGTRGAEVAVEWQRAILENALRSPKDDGARGRRAGVIA